MLSIKNQLLLKQMKEKIEELEQRVSLLEKYGDIEEPKPQRGRPKKKTDAEVRV